MAPVPATIIDPALIAQVTNAILANLAGAPAQPAKPEPAPEIVSPIDTALGGKTGWKTVTGLAGAIVSGAVWIAGTAAQYPGVVEGAFGLSTLLLGAGALAKVDRFLRGFLLIAQAVATAAPKIVEAASAAQAALAKRTAVDEGE